MVNGHPLVLTVQNMQDYTILCQVAQDCPTPVFEPEEPPGYDALMETELRELPSYLEAEMRELPSYLEAVCHRELRLSTPVSTHRL